MGIRRVLALLVLVSGALVVYGCEDDPVLPPTDSPPDDGGSYAQMRFDVVPAVGHADAPRPDSASARRDARDHNPTIF